MIPQKTLVRIALASLLTSVVATAFANSAGDRIIHEIDTLKKPDLDRTKIKDPSYVKEYRAQFVAYRKEKSDLIWNLYQTDPNNPKTPALLEERWANPVYTPGQDRQAVDKKDLDEINSVLAQNPSDAIKEAADYSKVVLDERGEDSAKTLSEVNAFVDKHPKSDKAPELLFMTSFSVTDAERAPIYHKILANYPDFKQNPMIRGALKAIDEIGKPFALTFSDAVSGKPVDVSAMKGKLVLVDFWATWCGPCVAEMPTVKGIYSKYHDKGLEIVGVSLDEPEAQGGLTNLKDFVAKNQIPWPMYYQGNGWDSKFSSGWGIMSIPTMFIIDKNGNYQGAADARDADFTSRIEKLLGL